MGLRSHPRSLDDELVDVRGELKFLNNPVHRFSHAVGPLFETINDTTCRPHFQGSVSESFSIIQRRIITVYARL
jgi:hypothetical protein